MQIFPSMKQSGLGSGFFSTTTFGAAVVTDISATPAETGAAKMDMSIASNVLTRANCVLEEAKLLDGGVVLARIISVLEPADFRI